LTLTKADDVIRGMIRPAVLLVVFGVVVAGLFGPASAFAQPSADPVTVAQGTLRGAVSAEQRKFLNIPFAAPPTGERRFRPPQPPASWSGVRDATREGNVCPQSAPIGTVSEDCLVLNVHTPPAAASRNLPVMVWMHGGGYQFGSGSMYTSTPLVTEGGVIVVTVNYRMGPFGFLALPELAAESRTAGNWGVLDQQAALRWVRGNIRAFGGDPGPPGSSTRPSPRAGAVSTPRWGRCPRRRRTSGAGHSRRDSSASSRRRCCPAFAENR
jgi:para-nitrobenzyl esterase